MKANLKWISVAILLIILTGLFSPMSVLAADEKGSITIKYPVDGVSFRLYNIGTVDSKGNYKLVSPFDSYHVNVSDDSAAGNLAGYVNRDQAQIQEQSRKSTANGSVTFEGLENGVYLVLGDVKNADGNCYTPSPVLVSIPGKDADGKSYVNLVIENKWTAVKDGSVIDMVALKTWSNDSTSSRPDSITVQLMKNGAVFEEQVLNSKNNWTYEWKDLDTTYSWDILEKSVPDGYTVSYDKKKTGYVSITNKGSSSTNPPSNSPSSKIAQTGQLWWPVAVLLIAGLVLILVGTLVRRKQ